MIFNTFKIYAHKKISLSDVQKALIDLGYTHVDEVSTEGDFSVRGDTLELFPVNFNFPLRIEWTFDEVDSIYSFDKLLNKKMSSYDLLIVIPHLRKVKKYTSEDLPLDAVLQIKPGDYVVHSRYGIAKFLGVKQMNFKGTDDYYFELLYAGSDKLYVSREEAHLVQKYMNFHLTSPKLTKLGSKEWTRIKEKVTQGIKSFALELLRMQAQRKIIGGHGFSKDNEWQKQFEAGFGFKLTPDQDQAIVDTKTDMQSGQPMDRIVCGDVGYGKTEVAMRAAFKAACDGKQVVFLVPTTILAYQHYLNLSKRVEQFPIKVEMLSRFVPHGQQKTIIENIKQGKVDIIVGTHRLLSDDVEFKDLGLLIIDEEHKFGVSDKEKIKKMKVGVDILTLTATPIPRTLYMGLVGLKQISTIKTPPKDRLSITTEVEEFNVSALKKAITREIQRKGEIFIIHNRIETLPKIQEMVEKVSPIGTKIGVIHGQMPAKIIEETLKAFIDKKINCLISTAIVESGIDIPSANTIIITDAQRFGLADLHQLRGRVGRYTTQAYAYIMVPSMENLNPQVRKRLELIKQFSHLGAGFEVAMSDLEMRGAGNILGKEQSGYVWMVGFDLYCRLVKKEVQYLNQVFKSEMGM